MISALIVLAEREARRELADRGRLLFDVAWPLMLVILLGFGVDAFAQPKADLSYLAFLGPGVLGLLFVRRTISAARSLSREARHGFREYLVTPVHPRWIVLGSLAGLWVVHSCIALIVLAVYTVFVKATAQGLWLGIAGVVASIGASLSMGLVLAVVVENMRMFSRQTFFVVLILALVSGVFFPIEDLPFSLQYISFISPLTYMIDSIRGPLVGVSHFAPLTGLVVTSIIAVVCIGIGIWKSRSLFRI